MRGSALRAPRGLAGTVRPRAPRPRGALPLVGSPASELSGSGTSGSGVRPLKTRAQVALLPETPARKGPPLSAYPRMHEPFGKCAYQRMRLVR